MKNRLIQIFKIALPVGLGVYLVVHIYSQLDQSQRTALFESFRGANYFWVALSFCLGLLSHYIRGFRWGYQLEAMGYESKVSINFMAVMSGYLVNMILPRVGEVSRAMIVQRHHRIPFHKGFGSIMAERALDFIILLVICAVTVTIQYNALKKYADALQDTVLSGLASPLVWLALLLVFIAALWLIWWLKKMRSQLIPGKIFTFIEGLLVGLRSVFRMKKRGMYLISTLSIWLLYIAMFWCCFFALEETKHLGADAVFAGFVIGSFAIVLIPGGIGAFPVGIMEVLVLYGIAQETGFALGWILWFSQTTMIVVVGGLCMLLLPIFQNKKSQNDVATRIN